ncbi:hypothetical protein HZB88_01240 [archaeon]|nr:hypothetical protein [archaeon]
MIPNYQNCERFSAKVAKINAKVDCSHHTEDSLLPRLMSGKIRIPVEVRA